VIAVLLAAALGLTDDMTPPRIEHSACAAFQKGQPFTIVARIYDESPIFDPKVHYKIENEARWKSVPFVKDAKSDDFKATIKANELRGALVYFIEAFDENGNGPAQLGTPESPIRVPPADRAPACTQVGGGLPVADAKPKVDEPIADPLQVTQPPPAESSCGVEPAPWWCDSLVWGGIAGGVVIVGIGVGVLVWALSGDDGEPRRTPIAATVEVTGVPPASAIVLW
jgi:hypothetical protein